MFSGGMPAPSAGCCLDGIWLGDQISSRPSLPPWKCAVEFCGSSGACDSSGKKYSASMVFAAVRNAASTSPITALGGPPGPPRPPPGAGAGGGGGVGAGAVAALAARSRACTRYVSLLCDATAPSSQTTFSELRASLASHQLSATIATPEARELLPCPAGSMMNTCLMPGSFLISSRLALTTFPPKTSHFTSTAWSMFGKATSMLKIGRPVTMSRLSTLRIRLPMILKSRGFLSAASMAAVSGTGRLAALDESDA